jgi:hypothetical protein
MSDVPAAASLPDNEDDEGSFPDTTGYAAKKASHESDDEDEDYVGKKKIKRELDSQEYILGTLIVRVVAARDLEVRINNTSIIEIFTISFSMVLIQLTSP